MNEAKKLFNIGEVSKICKIPISTLRYYDKIKLIIPEKIDPFTGYRYYNSTQISIIDTVTYLRYLDISLDDIKEYLQNPNEDHLRNRLQEKVAHIDEEIQELTAKKQSIQFMQDQLQEIVMGPPLNEVYLKKWRKRSVWALEATDATSEETDRIDYIARNIHNNLFPHTPVFGEQMGTILSYADNIGKKHLKYKLVFLEVSSDIKASAIRNFTLPEGEYLCIRYRWSSQSSVEALESLRQYIEEHGLKVQDEVIDLPIVTGQCEIAGPDHVMELQVRILKE